MAKNRFNIEFLLLFDLISILFLIAVLIITFSVILFRYSYMENEKLPHVIVVSIELLFVLYLLELDFFQVCCKLHIAWCLIPMFDEDLLGILSWSRLDYFLCVKSQKNIHLQPNYVTSIYLHKQITLNQYLEVIKIADTTAL